MHWGYGARPRCAVPVLYRSAVFLEFHRQFTHSLVFIPVGALLVFLALRAVANRIKIRGLATVRRTWPVDGLCHHGLLDSCTSYGTQLFWPFSDARVAWDTMSIVDPLFTIPLLVFVITARTRHRWLSCCLRLDSELLRPRATTRARDAGGYPGRQHTRA